jgi:hypothetical protein
MKKHLLLTLGLNSALTAICGAALTYYSSTTYRGRADNPILNEPATGLVYVEDFEIQGLTASQVLHTPNATGWNGVSAGSTRWGVQEDYSDSDLSYYWTNSGGSDESRKLPLGIHFDFTPDAQGRLPEYVGAALRGSRILGTNPDFNVILVYDRIGQEVTNGEWLIPKPPTGQAIEDLFINFEGIYVPGGISRILFRDFREVDHLTYGYAIPEPSAVCLTLVSALCFLPRRRANPL